MRTTDEQQRSQVATRWWLPSILISVFLSVSSWAFGYNDNYFWLSEILPVPRYVSLSTTGRISLVLSALAVALGYLAWRSADGRWRRLMSVVVIAGGLVMVFAGVFWATAAGASDSMNG